MNPKTGSNLFFWYFPAQNGRPDAPTVLWLQGGPGGSSLMGNFVENGPFAVNQDLTLSLRNTSWNLGRGGDRGR